MSVVVRLTGIGKFANAVNKVISNVDDNTMNALIKSAVMIRRHMDKVEGDKIPVGITGNLRASWFATPDSFQRSVTLGFTANYAIKVHENMEAKWRRKGASAKFLEKALKANGKTILNTIKEANKL